jgi:adenylyltransferase/sulfurtransferase
MIRIEPAAWQVMVRHAVACFPRECCGILLGSTAGALRVVTEAVDCPNAYEGDRPDRFTIDPKDILRAQKREFSGGPSLIGFFHSHPNEDSYFSATDLANSWAGVSNVVLSVREGRFLVARCFIANEEKTASTEEELSYPPMPQILIPTPLRQYTGGNSSVKVAGSTVGEVLASLTTQYPDLRKNLYTDEGKLRSFVNIYVNDEDIRYLNREATPCSDGDSISIIPSIAGGR